MQLPQLRLRQTLTKDPDQAHHGRSLAMTMPQAMKKSLGENRPFVAITIVAQAGSTPRTAGAHMALFADGSTLGTVGGGRSEADAAALAMRMLQEAAAGNAADNLMRISMDGATDMDMICGGSFSLLLELVLPGSDKAALLKEACRLTAARRAFCRLTAIFSEPGGHERTGSCRTGSLLFTLEAGVVLSSPEGPAPDDPLLSAAREVLAAAGGPFLYKSGGAQWFVEPFFPEPAAYIFGAGHVAVETAAIAARAGFLAVVIDDRPEFANADRFPAARPVLLPDLAESTVAGFLADHAPGPDDAVIIVTRGHAHDRSVLAAALGCGAGYLGMIGSRSKRDGIYAALKKRGFATDRLAAVHSPVGLDIGAETPAEIAVSIVAELVRWRRQER